MRSTESFTVSFIRRLCKNDKTRARIYARISMDGEEPREISLKEEIEAKVWDERKEQVRGKGVHIKAFNDYLDDVRAKIKEKKRELEMAEKLVTPETVKGAYLGIQKELRGHRFSELLTFFKTFWEPKLEEGTFKNYRTTLEYLHRFLEKVVPGKDLYLSQLDMQTAANFELYVHLNPIKAHDPCEGNGLGKHIQRFKRVINWAVELEWLEKNPIGKYKCEITTPQMQKLTIRQLIALEKQHFANPTVSYVKDLFLHSCYTGFAFVDAQALTEGIFEWQSSGKVLCRYYREKSGELGTVPILSFAAKILNKYRNRPSYVKGGPIFPRISNQEVNRSLKIIQEVCGIPFNLTFHIARHTFAQTVALKNKIPIEVVQILMGHKKLSSTKIYATVDEEKLQEDTQGWEERIEKKREAALATLDIEYSEATIEHWAS